MCRPSTSISGLIPLRFSNSYGSHPEELLGDECYGGIKLVGAKGLSAFALLFPGEITRIKMFFWMPESYIHINPDGFDGYGKWKEYIKIDAGNTVENTWVSEWLTEEISKYQMHSFAFPKGKDNDDIVQHLIKGGIVGNPISQTVGAIGTPTSQWEDILTSRKVEHYNNPVLAWMNGNCNVVRKEAGIRVEEIGSKTVGISACINALAQYKSISATELDDRMILSW